MNKHLVRGLGLSTMLYLSSAVALPLYDVTVAADGSGDFRSVQQAIEHAPDDHQPYVIYIRNGVYHEKLEVKRPNIHLIGEDRDKTVITATTANSTINPKTGKKFGTTGSRTVNINATDFSAQSLTIENGFDYPANQAKDKGDPTRIRNTQAVALLISRKADKVAFKDVSLKSYQDTFYTKAGRTYFDKSRITGTVDFIFGHGTALFERSDIVARYRGDVKEGEVMGYITAPSTNIKTPFGLVFKDSRLSKEEKVPAHSYGLGRPWHPTRTFVDGRYADPNAIGHSAFINCQMDDHIYGWDKMSGKDIHHNKIWFYPKDSRFLEFKNVGPGANSQDSKRPQLSAQQFTHYTNRDILSGWQPGLTLGAKSTIRGEVIHAAMTFPAEVTIKDSMGKTSVINTDKQGHYHTSIAGMTPPLLVSADDQSGASCLKSDKYRSICSSAIVAEVKNNGETTANINPFSDLITSSLAAHEGIKGPQLLLTMKKLPAFSHQAWLEANQHFVKAFQSVAEQFGLNPGPSWNPVNYTREYQPVIRQLASQVIHNRGYDTKTGLAAKTYLTDLEFRPIINLKKIPDYILQDHQLSQAQDVVRHAQKRIFIVGDSTASNYESDVYPRMGWGQAFDHLVSDHKNIQVIDGARSGRSSRDYINGRWLSQMAPLVQPGDYLFIQFSHNDEKCNGAKKKRGPIDVANLCTYPNDAAGNPQYPEGHRDMSLQITLEKYLSFAKQHHLHPVMLTSLPRAKTVKHRPGVPITPVQHTTKQNKANGYHFFGSYTQTVKDTAAKHHVPLLDMQSRVIEMANRTSGDEWKKLWLAVDPEKYPFYKTRSSGTLKKPDTTHFQEKGANKVAQLVVKEIKHTNALSELTHYLP
ncbi:pectinesterase family protein [Vibrio salinus]|uniref:pectinesterase family protein n=1 Tax=Vibrio salinus TaxID=2899784 RepID=UPI001E40DA72|nr:pectinesterase family protein [Vibrio salinus]MCE0493581.1 pectinesterase family protein [Vibrio salinus]